MIIDTITIPDELMDSLRNNRLVIFAGAGVSRANPCNLPDFKNLAQKVGEGTNLAINLYEDKYDVYLGKVKQNGIDVHKLACDVLSVSDSEPSTLHKSIIRFFKGTKNIRIVTTNFDLMFEKFLKETGKTCEIYSSPALPLGNNFNGIVHLHGSVKVPTDMIITDEDFGKGYITEGYVTSFFNKVV